MRNINEGLQQHDLDDLILPMISIDEFHSKIDDRTTIVVALYVFDEDPAHDLSNFIERSPENVLDTDVSPAMSREGYYLTFVEMQRDDQFPEKLMKILLEVQRLTNITEWQFTSIKLGKGEVLPVTLKNLAKYIDLKPKPENNKEKVQEFLAQSSLHDFLLENKTIIFIRGIQEETFIFETVTNTLPEMKVELVLESVSQANRLQRMLDGPYEVWASETGLVIHNTHSDSYMQLKRL
jgi:hypothetical protein